MARQGKGKRVGVAMRFEPSLLERIDAFAARAGLDRHAAVCDLVLRGLDPVSSSSASSPARTASSTSATLESARLVAERPKRRVHVGFHPVTGEPLYREA